MTFPSDNLITKYQEAVHERHSSLNSVYCFADGMKIPFETCKGLNKQSKFYNGWLHGHYITNLFVFGADGRIINAIINVPGIVHDSMIAIWGGTYDKLDEIYRRTGGVCCVDSAFAAMNVPYLINLPKTPTSLRHHKSLL